jgi:hypothetical protein
VNDGFAELDAMIARIRKLPELVRSAAPEIADAVHAELDKTIARGADAYGTPWKPREDGGRPLVTAGKALVVVPVGKSIVMRLFGHIARHHNGRAKGGIYRRVIPTSGTLPDSFNRVIKRELVARFDAITKGS